MLIKYQQFVKYENWELTNLDVVFVTFNSILDDRNRNGFARNSRIMPDFKTVRSHKLTLISQLSRTKEQDKENLITVVEMQMRYGVVFQQYKGETRFIESVHICQRKDC